MDLQLQGKRVLVTGSSSGIGTSIAQTLAAEGAHVVVHGRDRERTHAVTDELRRSGAKVMAVIGDLSRDEGVGTVADAIRKEFGALDILVNNAGSRALPGNPSWFEVPPQAWAETFERFAGAAVRLCHHFVPAMKEQGWGRVINIGSSVGTQPNPFIPDYEATKAAINNMTVSLAKALSRTGITVNTVSPGTILTPALDEWLRDFAKQMKWGDDWEEIERRYTTEIFPLPVPRLGRPEDIAAMVAWVASPRAGYVTGANIRVDGGHCQSLN